jgi:hypothetical protein
MPPSDRRVTIATATAALANAESFLYTAYVVLGELGETKMARCVENMQHKLDLTVRALREGDTAAALDALTAWGFRDKETT